jgi:DNA-directed RNA polymerase subunit RPC12/RpoP
MSQEKLWTIVLRCYNCSGKFTLVGVTFHKLTILPLVAPCPHCDARPVILPRESDSRMHIVFDLRRDRLASAA